MNKAWSNFVQEGSYSLRHSVQLQNTQLDSVIKQDPKPEKAGGSA